MLQIGQKYWYPGLGAFILTGASYGKSKGVPNGKAQVTVRFFWQTRTHHVSVDKMAKVYE